MRGRTSITVVTFLYTFEHPFSPWAAAAAATTERSCRASGRIDFEHDNARPAPHKTSTTSIIYSGLFPFPPHVSLLLVELLLNVYDTRTHPHISIVHSHRRTLVLPLSSTCLEQTNNRHARKIDCKYIDHTPSVTLSSPVSKPPLAAPRAWTAQHQSRRAVARRTLSR